MRRWPKRVLLAALGILLGLVLTIWLAARRQLPDLHAPPLAGLSNDVRVAFDARGIPTVQAANLLDAFRAEGYLHARERMFEMELQRRAAEGRLAELFGAPVLPLDRLHRVYGFQKVAEEAVPLLARGERAQLEAYAAGVNAFIESRRDRWGLEFALLRTAPAPWTPAHSLEVLLLMNEELTTTWRGELRASSVPAKARELLMPRITAWDVLLVPDADPKPQPEPSFFFRAPHTERGVKRVPMDTYGLPPDAGLPVEGIGSNSWVVSGSRTESGKAMLVNDPHLGLREPVLWYALRIEVQNGPPAWVQGVSIPGLPGIVLGQNDRVAWGFTNLGTDVQDLYLEDPIREREERIAIAGGKTEVIRVGIGRHGPQIRPGYSLHWAALDPQNVFVPVAGIAAARDWKSFNEAFDRYPGPAQNVMYADIDGHIGWRASGRIPVRREGTDGSVPYDGNDPGNDWRGYVPQAQMPRVFDPPQGYLVTANQRVIGTSFPHPVATRWASPARARRIAERIEAAGKLDRDAMEQIELDDVSLSLRQQMRLLAPQMDVSASNKWNSWEGAAGKDSELALEAEAFRDALRSVLHERALGESAEPFSWWNEDETFQAALRADAPAWQRAGLGDKLAAMRQVTDRASSFLEVQHQGSVRTWGSYNRSRIVHPFGQGGGFLGWIFNPPSVPQSGCSTCPRVARPQFGQSMRHIVDWGAHRESTLVLPLGQSGHLGSPHRTDQWNEWLRGDPGGKRTRLLQPPESELVLRR